MDNDFDISTYAGTSSDLHGAQIAQKLKDTLDASLYAKIESNAEPVHRNAVEFSSNGEFWTRMLKGGVYETQEVSLKDFYLTEWTPLSPGLYFTQNATFSREQAGRFGAKKTSQLKGKSFTELLPGGKVAMIDAG